MNCQCGKELNGKQRKYCSEDCARDGKNNSTNAWRNNNKEIVKEYGKQQRNKAKERGELGAYRDYTHMLPVDLMLKINHDLITLKKDKNKLLEEYKENRNFKYIKLHIERVTKGAEWKS